jgi:hypothetical protein
MKKRFGVLRTIANVLKVLGVVVGALALLGALITFVLSFAGGQIWSMFGYDANSGFYVGIMMALAEIVFGALYALLLYGYGELILLLLSLEENTHKTAILMDKMAKK